MLSKMRAALAHRLDDGREVVVGEDHLRRLLGHLGAGDAHGDADVGRLQRRRVVDAVAGHRDDVAVGLQRVDDAQLVRRRDAGVDRASRARRRRSRPSSSASSSAPVSAGAPGSTMPRSAAMRAAVRGWSPVIIITRMPARRASRDGHAGLGARRIDDADRADEDQVALERLGRRSASSPAASGR